MHQNSTAYQTIKSWLAMIFIATGLIILATGCGQPASPEGTAKAFYEALANNKVDDATKLVWLGSVDGNDMNSAKAKVQMLAAMASEEVREKGGLKSVKTKLIKESADDATVELALTYGNGKADSENTRLKKDKGRWKIRLDKE